MKCTNLLILISCLWIGSFLHAQSECPTKYREYLDISNVKAAYWNGGDMFWDLEANPAYTVPYTPGMAPEDMRHSAFGGGIWMGGLDEDTQLRVAAQTYRERGNDFFSGAYRPDGSSCGILFNSTESPQRNGVTRLSNGKIILAYAYGFDVYDPFSNVLENRILPPGFLEYEVVELPDGRVMFYGGRSLTELVGTNVTTQIADPSGYFLSPGPDLLLPHYGGEATILPTGEVLFISAAGTEQLDLISNTSVIEPTPPFLTYQARSILLPSGQIWLSGGFYAPTLIGSPSTETAFFDPLSLTWTTGPDLLIGRAFHNLIELGSGEIILIGGNRLDPMVSKYDPVTNILSTAGNLIQSVEFADAIEFEANKIWIAANELNQFPQQFEVSSGATTELNRLGMGHSVTRLPGGILLAQMEGRDFVRYDAAKDEILGARFAKIWKVNKTEIDQFILDQAAGSVDFTLYPDIESWPGNGNTFAGEDYHLAPFVDVNNDGKYRPEADGDYPCITGDQALWWVFNDDGEHTETGAEPLQVQVKAMAYGYDCDQTSCLDERVEDATFLRFEVVNKSERLYTDYYFGYWLDIDIGLFADDYIGCDTNSNLGFGYNGDAVDEGPFGYGTHPPALGIHILSSPEDLGMTNFMYYENDFSLRGVPETPADYYNYLRSVFKNGSHLVDNGINGYPPTSSGPNTNYMYPGDPGWCGGTSSGWSESSADGGSGNSPFDRRMLLSSGPVDFGAGDTLIYDFAVVWGRGLYNDNKGSVCELKSIVSNLQNWWNPNTCLNVVLGNEPKPESNQLDFEVFPNPSLEGAFTVKLPEGFSTPFQLTLTDMVGRTLKRITLPRGVTTYTFEGLGLDSGIYLLKAQNHQYKGAQRVIIQK